MIYRIEKVNVSMKTNLATFEN